MTDDTDLPARRPTVDRPVLPPSRDTRDWHPKPQPPDTPPQRRNADHD